MAATLRQRRIRLAVAASVVLVVMFVVGAFAQRVQKRHDCERQFAALDAATRDVGDPAAGGAFRARWLSQCEGR